MTKRLGIMLSGNGTTYANLQRHVADGVIDAEIVLVIASRPDAYGLVRAADYGHRSAVTRDPEKISELWREVDCDLVAMCGYMRYYDPPRDLAGRVVNTHPGLLPAFSGKGMYGIRVHRAVVERGVKVTGCSVHLVEGPYDSGPILAQRVVPVEPGDDAEAVEARVQAAERHLYPLVVGSLLAHGMPLRSVSGVDERDFGFS